MTPPQNFKLRKCEVKNSSKSVSTDLFIHCGSGRDLPHQISCENFVMGFSVGFRVSNPRSKTQPARIELHAFYLRACPCEAMYRMQESYVRRSD